MRKQKKEYLSAYLLQETKISRLKTMIKINPELEKQYKKEIDQAIKLRQEIEQKILAVDGGILSEVLFQKYVFGKTLEDISYTLNYSSRHIERLHIKALDEFQL